MRYFNKKEKTEAVSGFHDLDKSDVVALDDDNVFFAPLPEGKEIEYDAEGIPIGYIDYVEPAPTQEQINTEYRTYLASTDWYVIRAEETKKKVPAEILKARAEAREGIIE